MKKPTKMIFHLLVILLGLSHLAEAQMASERKYVSDVGSFSFELPEGWSQIPASQIDAFNRGRPEIYQFQGGIVDKKSSSPKVYMLLQVKRRPAEPKEQIDVYRNAAIKADDFALIAEVIRKNEYREKPEFYSPKHDAFLRITKNGPQFSLMVKRFTDYGYFIMHFYLGSDPVKLVRDIDTLLASFQDLPANEESDWR